MNSDKWYSGETQVFWTCKAFLDGRTITHKTEIREVHGWRLGAIVHRLKTRIRLADRGRVSRPGKHRPLFAETRHRPHQTALPSFRQGAGRDGGRAMTRLRIDRLRRRFGLSETQARLLAALVYGGRANG